MRHQKKGKILGRKQGPKRALLKNLAASVILHEKVKTTKAKAKAVQPVVEKLITSGKKGDLNARRKLLSYLPDENAVKKVLEEVAPKYKERAGGYTRIVKIGPRRGDGAEMVQIELV